MKTSTQTRSGELLGYLKKVQLVFLKNKRTGSLLLMLLFSFLIFNNIQAQTPDLKKGYSKQDFIAATSVHNEKKVENDDHIDEKCGFIHVEEMLSKKYPNRNTTEQFEQWMQQRIENGDYNASRAITTIPVVIHVIHNGEPIGTGSNISDDQVLSQLVVLNEDFRRLNADAGNTPTDFLPVAADGEIEFCLATVTPDGTQGPIAGIHRYDGGQASYSINDLENVIKPATAWHPEYYFNIWVAPLQGGLLGYAQFPSASGLPGMPADGGAETTDGIVVRDFAFGTTGSALAPFDLGRTTTHEAGHFFGLRHNGGDGGCGADDFVTDTPTQNGQNNNFASDCSYPADNDCIDTGTDYPDMFMNYMDYSDDACMNLFTLGQKVRFDVVLANSPRRNFELSQVCNGVQPPDWVVEVPGPPANDLCENAEPISCGSTVTGTTVNSTLDNVGTCGTTNTAGGVWYSFVATGNVVNLSTCNQADYDTKISVFSGSCANLVCEGGLDDSPGCAGFTTSFDVFTTPGDTYFVLVHGFGSATGNFDLSMSCPEPPANDLCENAQAVQCGDVITGNTELASDVGAQNDCSDDPWADTPGIGVWYTVEGTGGDIVLSTCNNANFDTRIDVFTGTCDDLTCYAGNDDGAGCAGFTSDLTFASASGETYYIYVSGFLQAIGDFTLTIDCLCFADAGDCATVYHGYAPAECTDLTVSAFYGVPPYAYEWSTGETTETITVCPTTTTIYSVTITDAEGCVSIDEVTVDVIDVRCGKKLNKVEICHIPPGNQGNPQLLCVSANAVPAHLAHGDHLGACGITPCDGFYTGESGAGSRLIGNAVVVDDDDWSIYPNPAYETASVDLSILHGQEVQVTIYDVTGKVMWNHPSQILESTVIDIDLTQVPSGIYQVVLRTNNQSMVKKLVINK